MAVFLRGAGRAAAKVSAQAVSIFFMVFSLGWVGCQKMIARMISATMVNVATPPSHNPANQSDLRKMGGISGSLRQDRPCRETPNRRNRYRLGSSAPAPAHRQAGTTGFRQARAAEEVGSLPDESAITKMLADYSVLRDQARACR